MSGTSPQGAIRRTPTITYDYKGGPIPDNIRKCYVQQQLPVRQQSLAAYATKPKRGSSKKPPMPAPLPPPLEINEFVVSVESATPITPSPNNNNDSPAGNSTNLLTEDEDEDDFDFKDRPPSSIICKPMEPKEEDVAFEFEDEDPVINDDVLSGWSKPSDLGGLHHHNRSDSTFSIDTTFTDFSETTSTTDSVFLRMQQKRDDQQKSIDAYYRTNDPNYQPFYTALLSQVASELYKRITLCTLVKDDIEHHDVFHGKEAVDRLASILKTTDRKLALAVGRALRHDSFFHDLSYEESLHDDEKMIYQFRDMMEMPKQDEDTKDAKSGLPNGVFTSLTDCYSPTCTTQSPCYSFSCPTKMSLKRSLSQTSIPEIPEKEDKSLWVYSVPESIIEMTPAEERKRQECIYELIYTEKDFVRDLQYLQNLWIKPLLSGDIIKSDPTTFVENVFFNLDSIEKANGALALALERRQTDHYLVPAIGDIMLQHVCNFDPFVAYGAHQMIGKFHFELEKKRNPGFSKFVEETERAPQSRRLELNGYLTKPTTRLGRYNLLLREILKRTPDNNPDKETIPQVMDIITNFLVQVNTETGKAENAFNIEQFKQRFSFKSTADYVDLQLDKQDRQIVMKGRMKRKGNTSSEASDLQVFLFDHYLVFAKIKYVDYLETYKAYRKPIPLALLSFTASTTNTRQKRASILPYSRSTTTSTSTPINNSAAPRHSISDNTFNTSTNTKTALSLTFTHHGRRGSPPLTLFTNSPSMQQIWFQKLSDQQNLLAKSHTVFSMNTLIKKHFTTANRVHSTYALDQQSDEPSRLLIGADQGVYVARHDPSTQKHAVSRILHLEKVAQIGTLPDSHIFVLADKTLWSFPYDILSSDHSPASSPKSPPSEVAATTLTNMQQTKRGRPVSQNTAFFHVGECLNKVMVCVVKANTLSGTIIRVLEPVASDEGKKTKSMFSLRRLVRHGPVGLKAYKDLYLPSEASSISLLKSKMCISSPREIGVVDMKNFGVQTLLDPEDENLAFAFAKTDLRPITVYRIEAKEYLVCFNEFAFFVDQRGRYIKSSVRMDWEGSPDKFALSYPYILAFEPDFIEVRHVHSGFLVQVIRGKNIKYTSTTDLFIQGTMDDPENEGYQTIFQLEKL